jgi:hypothetical protein
MKMNSSVCSREPGWFKQYHDDAHLGPRRIAEALRRLEEKGYTAAVSGSDWLVGAEAKELGLLQRVDPAALVIDRAVKRPVFGDKGKPYKQYIKDDIGTFTRRFAYCVRPKDPALERPVRKVEVPVGSASEPLKPANVRFANRDCWKTASALSVKVEGRDKWHEESWEVKLCLAYINYKYAGKLGYCLASAPLRVRDNEGKAFANTVGHSLWIVDLAMVPADVVLVNIYGRYPSEEKNAEWISSGTAKNRECFSSDLPIDAVVTRVALTEEMITGTYNWKQLQAITLALDAWCSGS